MRSNQYSRDSNILPQNIRSEVHTMVLVAINVFRTFNCPDYHKVYAYSLDPIMRNRVHHHLKVFESNGFEIKYTINTFRSCRLGLEYM